MSEEYIASKTTWNYINKTVLFFYLLDIRSAWAHC